MRGRGKHSRASERVAWRMLKTALVVKVVAKAGKEEEVTPVWFALRASTNTFYIVDAFASDEDRSKHLNGEIAAALMANASTLLADPPSIEKVDVLASKVTQ